MVTALFLFCLVHLHSNEDDHQFLISMYTASNWLTTVQPKGNAFRLIVFR